MRDCNFLSSGTPETQRARQPESLPEDPLGEGGLYALQSRSARSYLKVATGVGRAMFYQLRPFHLFLSLSTPPTLCGQDWPSCAVWGTRHYPVVPNGMGYLVPSHGDAKYRGGRPLGVLTLLYRGKWMATPLGWPSRMSPSPPTHT